MHYRFFTFTFKITDDLTIIYITILNGDAQCCILKGL